MQKTKLKASILIWSLFLMSLVSISFIFTSTTITSKIRDNRKKSLDITSGIRIKNNINTKIMSGEILNNSEILTYKSQNSFLGKFKSGEEKNITFSGTTNITNFNVNFGAIYYYFKPNIGIITLSGVLNSGQTTSLSLSGSGVLNIKNIGGYSLVNLNSNTDFKLEKTRYHIVKTIGGNEIIKNSGIINK